MTAPTHALAGNLRFLRALMARPKNIGAIVPSSRTLARAIARQIDPAACVLELGPGTGVVTQALLEHGVAPSRLTIVEYDPHMAAHLAQHFAGVQVIQGDAFELHRTLGAVADMAFGAIISSIPLLNFPMAQRQAFMAGLGARLAPGAPLIQFSYGTLPPAPPPPGFGVVRTALIWANIPPARVWAYRKY